MNEFSFERERSEFIAEESDNGKNPIPQENEASNIKGKQKKPRISIGIGHRIPEIKVRIGRGGEIEIEPKDPMGVLKKAEESFGKGDFEDAWVKLSFISEEDREKRIEELLAGNDEDQKLANEMYLETMWQDEVKADTWGERLNKKGKK